ncbi:MAG: diguanylate cyclase, partial [Anaerolineae bacterium]|nr:diguanylate cyclase [Anaerolineae bacterium]
AVPLLANGTRLGAIIVGFAQPHTFTTKERSLVTQAAGQLALILARMDALNDARKRAADSEILRKASAALTMSLDVQGVSRLILEQMQSLVNYDLAVVWQYQPEGLRPIAQRNWPDANRLLSMRIPLNDPALQILMHDKVPVYGFGDPLFKGDWGIALTGQAWLGLLLSAGNETVGVILLGRQSQAFSEDEVLPAQVLTNQAGIALQNALLHEQQHQLAITDPLTGLYNRRGFFELARHELEHSRRFNRPLSVMMLDIDHFKQVNDTYGHNIGDEVLRQLAERMKSVLREVDLICRYGGEEFCFVLPESNCNFDCTVANRIQTSVRGQPFVCEGIDIKITVSIGASTMETLSITLEELIEQADEALYQAKQQGRDRTVHYNVEI